jgi:hypothetical protein
LMCEVVGATVPGRPLMSDSNVCTNNNHLIKEGGMRDAFL